MVHEELRKHIEQMQLHPDGRVQVKATLAGLMKGQDLILPLSGAVAQTVYEGGGGRTHDPRLKRPNDLSDVTPLKSDKWFEANDLPGLW